jgi:hypothetical protein
MAAIVMVLMGAPFGALAAGVLDVLLLLLLLLAVVLLLPLSSLPPQAASTTALASTASTTADSRQAPRAPGGLMRLMIPLSFRCA